MKRKILIAHAKGEERFAIEIATPLTREGYEVIHEDTIFIGDSIVETVARLLEQRVPVLLCATRAAAGSSWVHKLIHSARANASIKIFALQMDEDAYMDSLTLAEKYGKYWQDPQ